MQNCQNNHTFSQRQIQHDIGKAPQANTACASMQQRWLQRMFCNLGKGKSDFGKQFMP